jgi:hypothetical protein
LMFVAPLGCCLLGMIFAIGCICLFVSGLVLKCESSPLKFFSIFLYFQSRPLVKKKLCY